MSSAVIESYGSYILPSSIATKQALAHLVIEFERIDNELTARSVHGDANTEGLDMADSLRDFLEANEFSLDNTNDRTEIIAQLRTLKRKVPVVHMAFATEADSASLGKIVSWFRDVAHKQTVIVVGFQPALVAGTYLRTPNRIHDLSLRSAFKKGRSVLLEKLESVRGNE